MSKRSAQAGAGSPTPTGVSARYRFFRWAVLFFSLCYLIVINDVATAWPGAESFLLWRAGSGQTEAYLPALLMQVLPGGDLWLFWPRLLSVLGLLLTALFFFRIGRPLFGRRDTETTLLLLAGSLLLPVFGKIASADTLALLTHALFWLALVRFHKQPEGRWQYLALAAAFIGGWINPVGTLLLVAGLIGAHWALLQRRPGMAEAGMIGAAAVAVLAGGYAATHHELYFHPVQELASWGRFLAYNLLGIAPFAGFLLAGLRDLHYKNQRGEELARLLLGGLLAAFAAQSLLFGLLLVLVSAKQLLAFFRERYPWGNYIKTTAVLHLVVAFMLILLLLLGGAIQFPGEGFSAALGLSAAYWMCSMVGVIGLFGRRRDYVLAGTVMSGVLSMLFMWVQLYPYIELDRSWPGRLLGEVRESAVLPEHTDAYTALLPVTDGLSSAGPYLAREGYQVNWLWETEDMMAADSLGARAEADMLFLALPAGDTLLRESPLSVTGRSVLRLYRYQILFADPQRISARSGGVGIDEIE